MSATLISTRYLPLVLLFWSLCTLHSSAISCPSPHIQSLLRMGNAPPANIVLGQSSFNSSGRGSSLSGLNYPFAVAVSPLSGKVFISDFGNNRVLRFAPPVLGQMGGTAEAVFGTASGCQQDSINQPYGIFVDSHDALWVTSLDDRVLRFDNSSYVDSGASASMVLGQTNFGTCNMGGTSPTKFSSPTDVWVEPDDTLWVADGSNGRVIRIDNVYQKANGAFADGVLGKPDFFTSAFTLSESAMSQSGGVVVSKSGDLYVSDVGFPRVVRYKKAKYSSARVAPDGLWGQSSYLGQNSGITATGLLKPWGVAVDDCNNLFVSDLQASRVTMYQNADGVTNLPTAALVFGQPEFNSSTNNNPTLSASSLSSTVLHIFYDTKNLILWVADGDNNRVLGWAYDGQGGSTTSSVTTAGVTTSSNQVVEDGAATLGNFITYLRSCFQLLA